MTTGRINQVTIRSVRFRAPTCVDSFWLTSDSTQSADFTRLFAFLLLNRILVQLAFHARSPSFFRIDCSLLHRLKELPFRAAHLFFAFLGKPSSTGTRGAPTIKRLSQLEGTSLRGGDSLRFRIAYLSVHYYGTAEEVPSARGSTGLAIALLHCYRPSFPSHVEYIRTSTQSVSIQTLLRCWVASFSYFRTKLHKAQAPTDSKLTISDLVPFIEFTPMRCSIEHSRSYRPTIGSLYW